MAATDEPKTIEAVKKSMTIIEALRELNGAGITELTSHLGLAKSTVHAHLKTLEEAEFVVQNGEEYRVGLRFLDFGDYAKRQIKIYPVIKEEVDMLAEESQEMAQFLVEEHGQGVYLYLAESARAIQTGSQTGSRQPLHCSALGKSILAHLPQSQVDEIIDRHGLPKQTPDTITDRNELFTELEAIREKGYALDDEEVQPGLRCVAAPTLNEDREVIGAVSISGPTSRMSGDRFTEELPEMVTNSANIIEVNIRHV